MTARPWASGSITPRADGRFWARLPLTHGRRSLGLYGTRQEAEEVLAAALESIVEVPLEVPTLHTWGTAWLATRGVRSAVLERDVARWRAYVDGAELGRLCLGEITERDVGRWWRGLRGTRRATLAAQTKLNAGALVRGALAAACAPGGPLSGRVNPAAHLVLPRGARARTDPGWTWLRQPELVLLAAPRAPVPARALFTFVVAAYTGLRAGELWGLRWCDVDLDRGVLHVRFSRGEATKGGQPREVPLLSPARRALEGLRMLGEPRSHLGLIWPARDGGHHSEGYDAGWSKHRMQLGISRAVRFHDLRHTCASHLLQGTWAPAIIARPLRLEEVQVWLGHSDITTTQRYAHLCSDALATLAARPDRAQQLVTELGTNLSHTADLNCGPTVYEGEAQGPRLRMIEGVSVPVPRDVPSAAIEVLELVAAGSPFALQRAVEVLERVALEWPGVSGAVRGRR